MGDLDPHLIHGSLGPSESPSQTRSRSVQPFFARLTIVTDRQCRQTTACRIATDIRFQLNNATPNLTQVINIFASNNVPEIKL